MARPNHHLPKWKPLFLLSITAASMITTPLAQAGCIPCENGFSGDEIVPGSKCKAFNQCHLGKLVQTLQCGGGLLYNMQEGYCDYDYRVTCIEPICTEPPTVSPTEFPTISPTLFPTRSPTTSPTQSPTASPTQNPTTSPTQSPTTSPTISPTHTPTLDNFALNYLIRRRSEIEGKVLIVQTSSGMSYPSVRYSFDMLVESLQLVGDGGYGGKYEFYLAGGYIETYMYGLVNLSAFLANAMVESISSDTCDELNIQQVAGKYAISNSCGQDGRSYQDEDCGENEQYACAVDPMMEIVGITAGNQLRAPPPMSCKPGTGEENYAGYWDTASGTEIRETPYSNSAGRIDTEGCCWWGRGALLTKGVCNIGKLNHFLGKKAAIDGRPSLYPDIDFCEFPEATCSSAFTDEMRWTTGLFEWAERVQTYNKNGWKYMDELKKFLDEDITGDGFIASTNRILSFGCHEVGCSRREVREADQRIANFNLIVNDILDIPSLKEMKPTRRPSPAPTKKPSIGPTIQPTPMTPLRPPSPGSEIIDVIVPYPSLSSPNLPSAPSPILPGNNIPSAPSPFLPSNNYPSTSSVVSVPSPVSSNTNSPPPTPRIPIPSNTNQNSNKKPIEAPPGFSSSGSVIGMQETDSTTSYSPTYNSSLIGIGANGSTRLNMRAMALVFFVGISALLSVGMLI